VKDRETPFEPPWGADGWPRTTESGLDEGDLMLIASMLELTPRQRLETLRSYAGLRRIGALGLPRARSVRPD
jgi:hypothetical protein